MHPRRILRTTLTALTCSKHRAPLRCLSTTPRCLARVQLPARALAERYPPRLPERNKGILYSLACPAGPKSLSGDLTFARFSETSLPEHVAAVDQVSDGRLGARGLSVEYRPSTFEYGWSERRCTDFHVNFADRNLFGFFESPLFAQDEIQVAEHPALMSLRYALLAVQHDPHALDGLSDRELSAAERDELVPLTTTSAGATPCIVMNVQRRIAVDTLGIYGNEFAYASAERVKDATTVLDVPTESNIIAMEAPSHGWLKYSKAEITNILKVAYTSFAAARSEADAQEDAHEVRVVTGHWGCGAYGGSRDLMAVLQILAAHMAGIDHLLYYTVDDAGTLPVGRALGVVEELLKSDDATRPLEDVVEGIRRQGYYWGIGDGN